MIPRCPSRVGIVIATVVLLGSTAGAKRGPRHESAPAGDPGKEGFTSRCMVCHQMDGAGMPGAFPPLAGSEFVNGPPEHHIAIVLRGLTGKIRVKGANFNGDMPAWAGVLTDEEIAAILTYERTSWGNTGTPVTAQQVAAIRKLTEKQDTPWTLAKLLAANIEDVPRIHTP